MSRLSEQAAVAAGWVRALLCLALLYVAVMTAWVGDDIQITFRQVWNFIHGDGMTFNYGERVQAFTHPAWFFVLSGAVFVTRELHVTTLVLSIILSIAAVMLLLAAEWRARRGGLGDAGGGRLPLLTPALLLLFSGAFCDYMTSGLENPLSYFLIGILLWLLAADDGTRHRRWMFLLLALLVLSRPDYGLLFLPLALLLAVTSAPYPPPLNFGLAPLFRLLPLKGGAIKPQIARTNNHSPLEGESERQGRSPQPSRWGVKTLLRDVWPGALLLGAWLVFATIYFGSPLPNTVYAKMASGSPGAELLERGITYYQVTLQRDPATLLIIAAGLALAIFSRRPALLALAAGQLLYLAFILKTGGDFMQGRFFATPVFLSVGQMMLSLYHSPRRGGVRQSPAIGGGGATPARRPRTLLTNLLTPALLIAAAAVAAPSRYPFVINNTAREWAYDIIADERRHYYWVYGMLSPQRNWPRVVAQPDAPPERAQQICGYAGGQSLMSPGIHWVDQCGLTDPFIARLPANLRRRPGHHHRHLPTDYILYVVGKADDIGDERLRGLLRDVTLAARAPALFTRERLTAIWRLNTGHHSGLDLPDYRQRWPRPVRFVSAASQNAVFRMSLSELSDEPREDGARWQSRMSPASWADPYVLPHLFNAAQITVDEPRLATGLQLSLSHMEDYEISINGTPVALIKRVSEEGLLQNHTITLPQPTMVRTITIQTGGLHFNRSFTIGHLRLL